MTSGPGAEASLAPPRGNPSPQLCLVVLGGRAEGAHIELHDVRFVAGETLEATLPALRRQWFGRRRGLHIDSYLAVRQVGSFKVELRREAFGGAERLWFVNVGGYQPHSFAEDHAFGLVVATTAAEAKRQALAQWLPDAASRHKDDLQALEAVDDCLPLEVVGGWQVHLLPTAEPPPAQHPDWFGYRPI